MKTAPSAYAWVGVRQRVPQHLCQDFTIPGLQFESTIVALTRQQ